jgi:Spy/CpxP family protein refolding chaperone
MSRMFTFASLATAALLLGAQPVQAQKAKGEAKTAKTMPKDKVGKTSKETAKSAQKAEDREEKAAKKEFKDQPKMLLKGIKLTSAEKKQVKDIEKRYSDQFKALEKDEDTAEKSGTPMTDAVQRIASLRDQERTDLRGALTPAQQARFDKNATRSTTKR